LFVLSGLVFLGVFVGGKIVSGLERLRLNKENSAFITAEAETEADFQEKLRESLGGIKEYRLDDGTRVDLLLPKYAVEIDWEHKWAEGIGQSIYYGLKTNRAPLVILLAESSPDEEAGRIRFCGIECWVYDTKTGNLTKK
jgi:hypothetical protein